MNRKKEHYSTLKLVLRILTLVISVWALVIAYQAKSTSEWVDDKHDNIIEKLMFKEWK